MKSARKVALAYLIRLALDERGAVGTKSKKKAGESDAGAEKKKGAADDADGDADGADVPTLEELTSLRGQSFEAMDVLIRTADEEERILSDEERAEYEGHSTRYVELGAQVAESTTVVRNEALVAQHELLRRQAQGPLLVGIAPEPATATRSLDEVFWSSSSEVAAGSYGHNAAFYASGARNPVEAVRVLTRSGFMGPAPSIDEFSVDHVRLIRSFQSTVANMIFFGLLTGKRGRNLNSADAFEVARDHPYFTERYQGLLRAMDVDTTGEGLDWVPTGIGATLHEKVRAAGKVAPLFARITIPTNPWKWPLEAADMTAYRVAEPLGDTETKFTPSTAGTGATTFDAEIFGARGLFSKSLDADSAIAVLPYVVNKVSQAFADAEEKAILDGDTDGTHQDSDIGASTTEAVTAWDGLRKKGLAETPSDAANVIPTLALLRTARALMAKFGISPAELAVIVGVASYHNLLKDADVRTVDKFGPSAIVLNGQLAAVDGIPLIVSEHVREDLNAAGVHDAVTTDRTYAAVVNRGEWAIGQREGIDVEVDESIYRETFQRLVIGFMREDFQNLADVSTNDDVAILFNLAKT